MAEYILIKAIGTCHYKPLLVNLNENRCFTMMYIFLVTVNPEHLKVILAQLKDPKFFDILLLALDTDQKPVVSHIFLNLKNKMDDETRVKIAKIIRADDHILRDLLNIEIPEEDEIQIEEIPDSLLIHDNQSL